MNHRKTIVGATLAIFIVSMGLIGVVGAEFFPSQDAGQITVSIKLPEGSALEKNATLR